MNVSATALKRALGQLCAASTCVGVSRQIAWPAAVAPRARRLNPHGPCDMRRMTETPVRTGAAGRLSGLLTALAGLSASGDVPRVSGEVHGGGVIASPWRKRRPSVRKRRKQ